MHRHLGNQVLHIVIMLLVILQTAGKRENENSLIKCRPAYSWLESLDQDDRGGEVERNFWPPKSKG